MEKEVLRVENIYASNERQTLKGIHLNLFKGESIALMGLSGSGTSLFVDTLCGRAHIQRGRMIVDEKTVRIENEADARYYGIYRISQEQTLIDELSIAGNFFIMRRHSLRNFFLNRRLLNNQARLLLERLGVNLLPTTMVAKLTFAEKQLVELAKAVGSGAKIIIFDETFTNYRSDEIARLKGIVDHLREDGISFMFRCHYIEEFRLFSEKMIIFRDNQIIKKIETARFDDSMVADYVVGHAIKKKKPSEPPVIGSTAFAIESRSGGELQWRFQVKHGEVLALLDVYSKGKEKLIRFLAGEERGENVIVRINGESPKRINYKTLHKRKAVLLPNPGQTDGLFLNMGIGENILFPSLRKVSGIAGYINHKIPALLKRQFMPEDKPIRGSIKSLSRNERMAISLERWLVYRPEVMILIDPYLQTDVVGSRIITEYIGKLAKAGTAIIILSSRPDKLKEVSNRIINMEGLLDPSDGTVLASRDKLSFFHKKGVRYVFEKTLKYVVALSIIAVYFLEMYPMFSYTDVMILMRQFAIMGFAVLGAYLIAVCDGANLSVGSQAALTSVLVVIFSVYGGMPVWLAVAITFIVAISLGALYALFTTKTGVPIVLFSFAMMYVLNGFNAVLQTWNYASIGDSLSFLIYGEVGGLPVALVIFIVSMVAMAIVLRHTYIGRSIFAVGGDRDEAYRSGLSVYLVKVLAYMMGFAIINMTGVFFLAGTSTGSYQYGNTYVYDVIAALCIGRISLWGGKGSLAGVILGTLSVILLGSYFTIMPIEGVSKEMIEGFIIVVMLLREHHAMKRYAIDFGRTILFTGQKK